MDEKFKKCYDEIVGLIEIYGKSRFAVALIRYYGLRSLVDRNELDDLKEILNEL